MMREWILVTLIDLVVCAAAVALGCFYIGMRNIVHSRRWARIQRLQQRRESPAVTRAKEVERLIHHYHYDFEDEPTVPRAQCTTSAPTRIEGDAS